MPMLYALALALVTTVAPGNPVAPGIVRGQVRSESTGAPLALAVVEVVDVGTPVRAVTDSAGDYVLRHVPAGRHIVRATHFDHAPFEVEVLVPPGGDMVVDLSLALRPLTLPPVLARAREHDGLDTMVASAPELAAASMRLLDASPGVAELGLAQAARGVPGGSQPSDPSDVLYVRGGAADLKLVLLDGAPVYAPFHVGGLLTPFESEAVRSAKLYLGGAPARYDGGLSYVLDLHTRSGRSDGAHADGGMDMLSARAVVDGPVGKVATYMLAGRGVHGLGADPLLNAPFPYMYGDGLGRVDIALGGGRSLRATGFWNRETVRLDASGGDAQSAFWGNSAGSLRYHGAIAGADGELTASIGEYDAMLPVGGERPMLADGTSRRLRLAADFSEPLGRAQLHWGASYDRLTIFYFGFSLTRQDSLIMDANAGGNALGAYVDGAWQPVRWLRLRGGLRADRFDGDARPRLGPRLSATWVLSDRSTLTLAGGRYHQYVRATEAAVVASGAQPRVHAVPPLSVAEASHILLALDQEMVEGVRLGVEGYYKRFRGVPSDSAASSPAQASGLDFWVRRGSGRVTGWLGYSLTWVWAANGAEETTDLFSERQLLSAGLGTPLIGHAFLDVRFSYGSGMPFTAVPQPDRPGPTEPIAAGGPKADIVAPVPSPGPQGDPVAPGPDDPYLRLDAQLGRSFDGRYRGMAFQFTPYVRVINALDRRDALFYQFDRTRDQQPQAVGALPLLPIVGFSWRF